MGSRAGIQLTRNNEEQRAKWNNIKQNARVQIKERLSFAVRLIWGWLLGKAGACVDEECSLCFHTAPFLLLIRFPQKWSLIAGGVSVCSFLCTCCWWVSVRCLPFLLSAYLFIYLFIGLPRQGFLSTPCSYLVHGSLRTGVTGNYEPHMGAGYWTWVLWRSSQCF